jgi:hypothetical protein
MLWPHVIQQLPSPRKFMIRATAGLAVLMLAAVHVTGQSLPGLPGVPEAPGLPGAPEVPGIPEIPFDGTTVTICPDLSAAEAAASPFTSQVDGAVATATSLIPVGLPSTPVLPDATVCESVNAGDPQGTAADATERVTGLVATIQGFAATVRGMLPF